MTPVDPQDPAGSKLRSVALRRTFLERFSQVFGAVRCRDLLPKPLTAENATPAVREMGIMDHCSILAASAAEIVEDLLREREMDQANHA